MDGLSASDDDAIFRVSGRRIMFSAIALDIVAGVHTAIFIVLLCNLIRLPVYHPSMMHPNVWAPYWRVHMPNILLGCLPYFMYLLVFYRRAALLVIFLILCGAFVAFGIVTHIFLWIDWNSCDTTLWCPCITGYTVAGAPPAITMTFCTTGDDQSSEFIAHVFLNMGLILMSAVLGVISTWIHFQYYYRNEAYEANNPRRTLGYNTISSEMMPNGEEFHMNRKAQPHLHDIRPKWV